MVRLSRMLGGLGLCAVVMAGGCTGSTSTGSPGAGGTAGAGATAGASSTASASGSGAAASPVTSTCKGSGEPEFGFVYLTCTIAAPSLVGNLFGDPAELHVRIFLPDDYETSGLRYPVVYALAGYGDTATFLTGGMKGKLAPATDHRRVILVFADGVNALDGSFYMDSPVSGNWDSAIAKDLVGYVDAHYRTIARPEARGITGHSMGGHGALAVGMNHPELFGAIYALSPGLFADDEGAMWAIGQVADPATIEAANALGQKLSALPASQRGAAFLKEASPVFTYAYGAAFAGDLNSPSLIKWPYRLENGQPVRDDAVWALWEGGFGDLQGRIDRYGANLRKLRGFGIDYGLSDEYQWISAGCKRFVELLKAAGIPVEDAPFEGDHQSLLGDRLANHMLPFMVSRLAAASAG